MSQNRRQFLKTLSGVAACATSWPDIARAQATDGFIELVATRASHRLYGAKGAESALWLYNGRMPGPEIRVRRGGIVRVRLVNHLDEPTSIHWHGIRIANAMDGVPGLTQEAVPPGATFDYEFVAPDAGTFWYHSHNMSWSQVTRGLFGPLIVEEEIPAFDRSRDITMVLTDWRLTEAGQFEEESMGAAMDWSHAGRLGNWLTVNGVTRPEIRLAAGQWHRLRLINTSAARVLDIDPARFGGRIIAFDGQAFAEPRDAGGIVRLGPSQRMDLAMRPEKPGKIPFEIVTGKPFEFASFVVDGEGDQSAPPAPLAMPARNDLSEPLVAGARQVQFHMTGGAMGNIDGLTADGKPLDRETIIRERKFWGLNGIVGMSDEPMFRAARGETILLDSWNDTAFPHLIHTHGHHFRIVERNGQAVAQADWHDGFLAEPEERTKIAFVADNPGKWMIHCHMLEHAAAGMMNWFEVV